MARLYRAPGGRLRAVARDELVGRIERVNGAAADFHPRRRALQVATIHDVILPDLADQMPYKQLEQGNWRY